MTAVKEANRASYEMSRKFELTGPREAPERPLSLWLRHHSAADHFWLEEKIGSMQAPMSRTRYAKILLMFRALQGLTNTLHGIFAMTYGTYAFMRPREHDAAIAHDLAAIGWLTTDSTPPVVSIDLYASFADALGAFYVAEGSALGNTLLLRQSSTWFELPPGATKFLSESASQAGRRFQAFKARLDAFDLLEPEARDTVLAGAKRTFRACGDVIDILS